MPIVLSDEDRTMLAYAVRVPHPAFDGTNPRSVSPDDADLTYAIIEFDGGSVLFGYPNDEVLGGHPLFERGLRFYGAFEVVQTSWIRGLDRRNRIVYPDRSVFEGERHIILTFHDSTFECLTRSWTIHESMTSPRREVVARMNEILHADQ
ncbi:MAG: hypothetical protein R3B68_06360 [Phycisphaerales bacterium]